MCEGMVIMPDAVVDKHTMSAHAVKGRKVCSSVVNSLLDQSLKPPGPLGPLTDLRSKMRVAEPPVGSPQRTSKPDHTSNTKMK